VRTWANADIGSFAFYVAQNFPTTSAFQRVLDIVAGGGNAGGNIRFLTQPASGAGVAAMLITPAGNTGLGLVPTYQLQLSVDSAAKPGTSTWAVVSDLRLKQNVEPVKDDSLAILDKLDWIRYEYNGQAQMPQGLKGLGLVAQTLREQMPEAVRSTRTKLNDADAEETDVLAIDYHYVLVHSARAIQQLSAEVKRLGALLNAPQS
jgi:hypothetical protein